MCVRSKRPGQIFFAVLIFQKHFQQCSCVINMPRFFVSCKTCPLTKNCLYEIYIFLMFFFSFFFLPNVKINMNCLVVCKHWHFFFLILILHDHPVNWKSVVDFEMVIISSTVCDVTWFDLNWNSSCEVNSHLYAENCQATFHILFRTGGLQPVLFDRKLPGNHRKFAICWMRQWIIN